MSDIIYHNSSSWSHARNSLIFLQSYEYGTTKGLHTSTVARYVCSCCTAHKKARLCNSQYYLRLLTTFDVDPRHFPWDQILDSLPSSVNIHFLHVSFLCLICFEQAHYLYAPGDLINVNASIMTTHNDIKHIEFKISNSFIIPAKSKIQFKNASLTDSCMSWSCANISSDLVASLLNLWIILKFNK